MTGTIADPESVRQHLGVELVDISLSEYASACSEVSDAQTADYASKISGMFEVRDVSIKSLQASARCALGLERLVERQQLGAVAIQDLAPELHQVLGTRPCLPPWKCMSDGVVFTMEIGCALPACASRRPQEQAASRAGVLRDIHVRQRSQRPARMGHAGIHNPELAAEDGVTVGPGPGIPVESMRCGGAWLEFIMARGSRHLRGSARHG